MSRAASLLIFLIASSSLVAVCQPPQSSQALARTTSVDLELHTGGSVSGLVVESDEHGIVVVVDRKPHVFAWEEVQTGSAFIAKRKILSLARGGADRLTAQDHFELGLFSLRRGSVSAASNEFKTAQKLDSGFEEQIKAAWSEYQRRLESVAAQKDPFLRNDNDAEQINGDSTILAVSLPQELARLGIADLQSEPLELRVAVLDVYRRWGNQVREAISKSVVLVETEHFLIWTDWEASRREQLANWCEQMYAAVCQQLGVDPKEQVFLAKCPVFCWAGKVRFRRFAKVFDGYDEEQAVGYTRSLSDPGHVHVVVYRNGDDEYALDRFACTLVHEGTHAVLHRLHSTHPIPHWVNEGFAELVAQRVLADRCPSGKNAALLGRQYARYNWQVRPLLESTAPIEVHEYALAHSLVRYLNDRGSDRFACLIRCLKDGVKIEAALASCYDQMTLAELEAGWRKSLLSTEATGTTSGG